MDAIISDYLKKFLENYKPAPDMEPEKKEEIQKTLPPKNKFHTANINDFKWMKPEIINEIMERKFVFMHGLPGRGKTHCLWALIHHLKYRYININSVELLDTVINLLETKDYHSDHRFKNIDCLAIDDLGKEKKSEFFASFLFTTIEHRINNSKFTIITSNLKPSEMDSYFMGFSSRISEGVILNFSGEDYRLKKLFKVEAI